MHTLHQFNHFLLSWFILCGTATPLVLHTPAWGTRNKTMPTWQLKWPLWGWQVAMSGFGNSLWEYIFFAGASQRVCPNSQPSTFALGNSCKGCMMLKWLSFWEDHPANNKNKPPRIRMIYTLPCPTAVKRSLQENHQWISQQTFIERGDSISPSDSLCLQHLLDLRSLPDSSNIM